MKLVRLAKQALLLCGGLMALGAAEVTRPYNLDYLDIETLEYFLSAPKEDFDVAVMFYAQWCNNCHNFAPYWDQISRLQKAGTDQSKLIMALFDCEADEAHSQLCTKAGVKHYPTISFFSLSGQKFSLRKPRHGTEFGGNWQYGDAVYDWLKTMSALSQWHRLGWGKKLRSVFFGKRTKPTPKALPMGIPTGAARGGGASVGTTTGAAASSFSASTTTTSAASQAKIDELEAKVKEYTEIAIRSSTLLDSILFPLSTGDYVMETDNSKNATDVFRLLSETSGWNSTDSVDLVLKACAKEISLDYCQRLSTYLTNDWVAKQVGLEALTDEVVAAFSSFLTEALPESEPYCLIIEDCILGDMDKEECRPKTCPFKDPAACRYSSACLSPDIQAEYAKVLNISLIESALSAGSSSETSTDASTQSDEAKGKKKKGWGLGGK